MAFSINVDGMDELAGKLDKLLDKAQDVAALGLYEGAGVMADKVSQAVNSIATEPFKYAAGGRQRKPSPEEKAIVAGAQHGVAKFRKTGIRVETSVGYKNSGYASLNGKTKPVPMIANAINSGTSFMQAQPFIRRAFSQGRGAAESATEAGIRKHMDKLNID